MKNPIKFSLKTEIAPLLILLAAISLSLWSYNLLPDQVITHWNFAGEADGWGSRQFHAILFPSMLAAIYLMFNFLPKIDPRSDRYAEFSGVYLIMRNFIMLIMMIIFAAATFVNLGYQLNIGGIVAGAVGLLIIVIGNYFGKLKRNYFVGIKTPWTLASENVWNKTHRLGSRLFIVWGALLVTSPWLPAPIAFLILFGGIIAMLAWLSIYSYVLYRNEKKNNK